MTYTKHHALLAEKYFHVVDVEMNSTSFSELFAADAHFAIWHFPTSIGHDQIKGGCQAMFDMVKSIKHSLIRILSVDSGTRVFRYFVLRY